MNFGVYDDSVYTILPKKIFCKLKQPDANPALTEFFPDKIYVFKGGFARHVMQVRLHNEDYITYQIAFRSACDAPQHIVYSQIAVGNIVRLQWKILGNAQLIVMLWQQMLQLIYECRWIFVGVYDSCNCVHAGKYFSDLLLAAIFPLPTVLLRAD